MEARDVTPPAEAPAEPDYEPPELVELGSFEELTQGNAGQGADGGGFITSF